MSQTILAVDNSASVRQVVKLTLTGAGDTVVQAVDGADGLEKARVTCADLVVTDPNMPRVTRHARHRDVVAVMQAARTVSQETIQGVMRFTALLATRMALIQDLEGEMNHMEFNAALKCQRLGSLGPYVRVITEELRDCGQRTAQAIAGAVVELQRLTEVTQSLVIHALAGSLDQSHRLLAGALETLGGIEQQSNVALSLLQENGAGVIRLLDPSAAGIVVNQNVTVLIENAVSVLPVHEVGADMGRQPAAELLTRIASIYTMESKRAVHARVVSGPQAVPERIVANDFCCRK